MFLTRAEVHPLSAPCQTQALAGRTLEEQGLRTLEVTSP
jgi:hypothetical protein